MPVHKRFCAARAWGALARPTLCCAQVSVSLTECQKVPKNRALTVHRAGQRVARCWLCGRAAGPCCHSRRPASRAQVHSSGVAMSGRARMCRMARSQRLYITHQRCGAVWRAGCGRACLRVGHPEQALRLGHLLVQRGELPPQHARLRARARLHRPGSARRALLAGRGGGASAARARGLPWGSRPVRRRADGSAPRLTESQRRVCMPASRR